MIKKFQYNKKRYKVDTDALQGYDLVTGHVLFFRRKLYGGSHKYPCYIGCEDYIVRITNESYGQTGQHTFTLTILRPMDKDCERSKGQTIRIKGRNLYPNCMILEEVEDVGSLRREKHIRGDYMKEMASYR